MTVGLESTLGYSDGTKFSRASETPGVPAWQSRPRQAPPTQALPGHVQPARRRRSGATTSATRTATASRTSSSPSRGPGQVSWWPGYWKVAVRADRSVEEAGLTGLRPAAPRAFDERPFADLDLADPDVDGDSLLDGEDDQDNDDFNNITEMYEVSYDLDGERPPGMAASRPGDPTIDRGGVAWAVNPFNPCARSGVPHLPDVHPLRS